MRYPGPLCSGGFGGADIHTAINLHGNFRAISMAAAVLPTPVGPQMTMTFVFSRTEAMAVKIEVLNPVGGGKDTPQTSTVTKTRHAALFNDAHQFFRIKGFADKGQGIFDRVIPVNSADNNDRDIF